MKTLREYIDLVDGKVEEGWRHKPTSGELNTLIMDYADAVRDAFDYGDERTVLLHLKRIGSSIGDGKEDNYGLYLGRHDGYVVGIKNLMGNCFIGCEVFETIEEMKTSWQLD
jgi:hypothetical protein